MKTYTEEQMKLGSKHNPGPWCVYKSTYRFELQQGSEPSPLNLLILNCGYHSTPSHAKYEANAHLISAAPEAIEFIADLLEVLDSQDPNKVFEMKLRAEQILKKGYNL